MYLFVLFRQIDVLLHVGLHPSEEEGVDGVLEHSSTPCVYDGSSFVHFIRMDVKKNLVQKLKNV